MQKVWIVTSSFIIGNERILGGFSTLRKAQAFYDSVKKASRILDPTVDLEIKELNLDIEAL